MRTITATISAAVLALAAVIVGAVMLTPPASAHTPQVGASCESLTVYAQGSNYEASDTNTVTVTLDGQTESDTFATDGAVSLPIPADGHPHAWSATVSTTNPDPAFSAHDEGTITCGDVPTEEPTPTPSETPTPTDEPTPTTTPTPTEPPTTGPPPVRSSSRCVGNALVITEETYTDGAWHTTSSSTINGAARCQEGQPDAPPVPVVEEGM